METVEQLMETRCQVTELPVSLNDHPVDVKACSDEGYPIRFTTKPDADGLIAARRDLNILVVSVQLDPIG